MTVFCVFRLLIRSRYLVSDERDGTGGAICGADTILFAFVDFVNRKAREGGDGKKILREGKEFGKRGIDE